MENIMLDLLVEDFEVDTEFDIPYELLEEIAPPANFVEQVMQKVAQLSLPTIPKVPWSHLNTLTVDTEPTSLS